MAPRKSPAKPSPPIPVHPQPVDKPPLPESLGIQIARYNTHFYLSPDPTKHNHICFLCTLDFTTLHDILLHISVHTELSVPWPCPVCHDNYPSLTQVSVHFTQAHWEVDDCSVCLVAKYPKRDKRGLLLHIYTCTPPSAAYPKCEVRFYELRGLNAHITTCAPPKPPKTRSRRRKANDKLAPPEPPGQIAYAPEKLEQTSLFGPWVCPHPECLRVGVPFTIKTSYTRHTKTCGALPSFTCPQCTRGFYSVVQGQRHTATCRQKEKKTTVLPVRCETCGIMWTLLRKFRQHVEQPCGKVCDFYCQACGKGFRGNLTRDKHQRGCTDFADWRTATKRGKEVIEGFKDVQDEFVFEDDVSDEVVSIDIGDTGGR